MYESPRWPCHHSRTRSASGSGNSASSGWAAASSSASADRSRSFKSTPVIWIRLRRRHAHAAYRLFGRSATGRPRDLRAPQTRGWRPARCRGLPSIHAPRRVPIAARHSARRARWRGDRARESTVRSEAPRQRLAGRPGWRERCRPRNEHARRRRVIAPLHGPASKSSRRISAAALSGDAAQAGGSASLAARTISSSAGLPMCNKRRQCNSPILWVRGGTEALE